MIFSSIFRGLISRDYLIIRIPFLCLMLLVSANCQPVPSTLENRGTPTPTIIPIPTPTETVSPMALAAWDDWEAGPHAAAYNLGKGPNTYCARCHSPLNWDAQARIDPPPNCVSCKFDFEETPRIAEGNPLISEEDWKGIGCEVCHPVENGTVSPAVTWFNQETGYYETLASSSDLCAKCHMDTETLRYAIDLSGGAHSDFTCTECHQPHTTFASCTAEGCHSDVIFLDGGEAGNPGHRVFHQSIDCIACHDASGLEVAPLDGQGIWTTFRTTELLGRAKIVPYVSHTVAKEVVCERCHFPENPWNILVTDPE